MTQIDVVGLGVSTVDVMVLVDHFPAGEEVQRALDLVVQGGGPVATALVALARLGANTAMLDVIGDDWRATHIEQEFQEAGVATGYLVRQAGCSSATATILVRQADGARTIIHKPGNVPELSADELPRALIEEAKILHINGRHWPAMEQAVAWAREAGVQVSLDGGAHRFRPEMKHLVELTDICIVARNFAEQFAQTTEIAAAAEQLLQRGPWLATITDGVRGSWVFTQGGEQFHQAAYQMPSVVDTTGCGDSYHGGFLYGLLQDWPLEKTAAFASAVAALNTQHLGGRAGLPTLAKVEAFLHHDPV